MWVLLPFSSAMDSGLLGDTGVSRVVGFTGAAGSAHPDSGVLLTLGAQDFVLDVHGDQCDPLGQHRRFLRPETAPGDVVDGPAVPAYGVIVVLQRAVDTESTFGRVHAPEQTAVDEALERGVDRRQRQAGMRGPEGLVDHFGGGMPPILLQMVQDRDAGRRGAQPGLAYAVDL